MRYGVSDARKCFQRLAKVMGKSTEAITGHGTSRKFNIGAWVLDYNAIYGGCVIEEIDSEGGGIRHPFGSARMPPREFCQATYMVERAIEIIR